MKNERPKCDSCSKKAEVRVESAEWSKEDKKFTDHYEVIYLCYKHFTELVG